jgi:rhodanese-related sulfurtransferase
MGLKRLIIDVREPFEYKSGHVEGAVNIPLASITSNLPELEIIDRDAEIITYCRTGGRSSASIQILKGMGFTNVVNGINAQHVANNYQLE